MSRVRVSELAKELGLETKAVLAQFNKLGVPIKNHLSMVSEGEVTKLKSALHPGKSVTDKDASQKSGSKIFIRRKANDTLPDSIITPSAESAISAVEKIEPVEPYENSKLESKFPETNAGEILPQSEKEVLETQVFTTPTVEHLKSEPSHPESDVSKSDMQKFDSSEFVTKTAESHANLSPDQTVNPISTTKKGMPDSAIQSPSMQNSADIRPTAPPTPTRSTSTFVGATIVKRAPESVYQVNMSKPERSSESGYQGYGPRRTPSEGRFNTRPSVGDNRYTPRPALNTQSGSGQPQKSFVMPDSLSPSKAPASRFKDYSKEREKRRIIEDNERNNKSRIKGARFYEKNETEELALLDSGNIDTAPKDSNINVRTMVSAKKRKPNAFKKRELQAENYAANPTKASKKVIRIDEHISVNDLAIELSQKTAVVIKTLMKFGMLATANKVLDFDTATLVAQEFGFDAQNVTISLADIIAQKHDKQLPEAIVTTRPPIITIMGHVDHGKTSLLDALRSTNVVASEAGGITQHIGAYQIEYHDRKLTFLDTPGHEAFTAMRARGAKVTDIVILVVAADDGVMPQTVEAIAHAKAANVPLIVAINKIDKPNINIDRIMRELSENSVMSEEWGGDSIFVQVSAKTKQGLDKLIEAILLQADVLELKAPQSGFAEGVVIEAKRDKARGPVATVIVTKGLLKQQDSIVIGKTMGRVRAMYNDQGISLKEALPGTPVELIGLDNVPDAGDTFNAVASDSIAREAVAYRVEKHRQAVLASQKPASTDDLMALFEQRGPTQKALELPIIIKADTHGSAEAIKSSLHKLDTTKVKTKVVLAAVGGITETDVVLADASRALIIGFNVRPDKISAQRAEATGIKIMFFNIIYELIDAVRLAMVGSLAPIKQDKIIGHAEVRNLFTVPKVGVIAGSFVIDGKITRPCRLRVVRDSIVLYTGALGSLKRFKEDAKEVVHGFECGIGVENYNDLRVGDVLEAYVVEEIQAEL